MPRSSYTSELQVSSFASVQVCVFDCAISGEEASVYDIVLIEDPERDFERFNILKRHVVMTGPVSVTRPTLGRSDRPGIPTPRIYPLGSTFLDGQMNFNCAEVVSLVAFWQQTAMLCCVFNAVIPHL